MKHPIGATIVVAILCLSVSAQRSFEADQVMKVDEQFRLAKLSRDTGTLRSILAENFMKPTRTETAAISPRPSNSGLHSRSIL